MLGVPRILGCAEDVAHALDEKLDRDGLHSGVGELRARQHQAGRDRERSRIQHLQRQRRRPHGTKPDETLQFAIWFMMVRLLEMDDGQAVFKTFPSPHAAAEAVLDGFNLAKLHYFPAGTAVQRIESVNRIRLRYLRHGESW